MAIVDKVGTETTVGPTSWGTMFASLAMLVDGRALLSWRSGTTIDVPGQFPSIAAQTFASDGSPNGAPFTLVGGTPPIPPETLPRFYTDPAVSARPTGGFVATWSGSSFQAPDSTPFLGGKIVDGGGLETPLSFDLPRGSLYSQTSAILADGSIALLTERTEARDVTGGVSFFTSLDVRIVGPSGSPIGAPISVNLEESLSFTDPVIAALDNGGFVVAWNQAVRAGDTLDEDLKVQVFDATGARVGAEMVVKPDFLLYNAGPAVAALPGGRSAVVWVDYGDSSNFDDDAIKARIFEANGTSLGLPISIETNVGGNPVIASVGPAGFVIAWETFLYDPNLDNDGAAVLGQFFDPTGLKIGGEFLVNTTTADYQDEPLIAGSASGRFVVAWTNAAVSPGTPSIDLQAFQAANLVAGTAGSDPAVAGTGSHDLMRGLAGDDGLFAGPGDDTFVGDLGDDTLDGGEGVDAVEYRSALPGQPVYVDLGAGVGYDGLGGRDNLISVEDARGGGASDVMLGSVGSNLLDGESGDDILFGGDWTGVAPTGDDSLSGGDGSDLLFGLDGSDRLDGGRGPDVLVGGIGDDAMAGGIGDDLLFAGSFAPDGSFLPVSGDDHLRGGDGADALWGFDGADTLDGGSGDDVLFGGEGLDVLIGDRDRGVFSITSNDNLFGEGGNDFLDGGGGFDYLTGGAGADTFVFSQGSSWDRVTDFSAAEGDKLRLEATLGLTDFANFQSRLAAETIDGVEASVLQIVSGSIFFQSNDRLTIVGIAPSSWTAAMVEFA